jgi:hypothetical protein
MIVEANGTFRAEEFCSSKLWQIVSEPPASASKADLEAAIAELAQRRHYLAELEKIGKYPND